MHVTVDTGEGLTRRMTVEIPEEDIAPEVQKRLQSLRGTVRMDGFRPGKVPLKVLERRFGNDVRGEVVSGVVQSSFMEAVAKENLSPAGAPTIDSLEANRGAGVSYTAVFEIYPMVTPGDPSELEVTRPVAEVSDADVDTMIDTLRRQRRTWEDKEGAAETGDQVVVDYRGTIDGEDFAGNQATDMALELGAGRLIDGFEDGLVGAAAGEERVLDLRFGEDYHAKAVAGKPVQFKVMVKAVKAAKLPGLDEEFVKAFGVESGNVDDLRVEVRSNMERELADALRSKLKQSVMDAMLAANDIDVPKVLLEQESERLRQQTQESLSSGGQARPTLDPSLFQDQARRRVALGLLLAEIVQSEGLQADEGRVRKRVESIASSYEDSEQVIRWYFSDRQRLQEIESVVMEDQIVDWVVEKARVTNEQTTFDAMMNPGQTS